MEQETHDELEVQELSAERRIAEALEGIEAALHEILRRIVAR